MNKAAFYTAYLPSREYFLALSEYDEVIIIDLDDYWVRQTVRNRAYILTTNGLFCLNIPVQRSHGVKMLTKDIRISYNDPWVRIHKGAISSAYNVSAYFEFFKEDLWVIYDKKPEFLLDFNMSILELFLKKFKLKTKIIVDKPDELIPNHYALSQVSNEKTVIINSDRLKSYPQVFGDKHPFQPNLSCLDILANTGTLF